MKLIKSLIVISLIISLLLIGTTASFATEDGYIDMEQENDSAVGPNIDDVQYIVTETIIDNNDREPACDVFYGVPIMIIDIAVDGPITDEMLDYGVPIRVYADGAHIATVHEYVPDDDVRVIAPLSTTELRHLFPSNGRFVTHTINNPARVPLTYSWNITSTTPTIQSSQVFGQVWYSGWGLLSQRSGFSNSITVTPASSGTWSFLIWNASPLEVGIRGTATLR